MEKNTSKSINCVVISHLFGGYTQSIEVSDVSSLEEITSIVISTLYSIFTLHNMTGLIEHLEELTFSTKKITFDDIKEGRVTEIKIFEDDYSSSDE